MLYVSQVVMLYTLNLCSAICLKVEWKLFSCVQLFATPWTIQSTEFSRPEYWSGWPFPSPGDLPNPGMEPRSPALQVGSTSWAVELPGKPVCSLYLNKTRGKQKQKDQKNTPPTRWRFRKYKEKLTLWIFQTLQVVLQVWDLLAWAMHQLTLQTWKQRKSHKISFIKEGLCSPF